MRKVVHQTWQNPVRDFSCCLQFMLQITDQFGSSTSLVLMKTRAKTENMALAMTWRPTYTRSFAVYIYYRGGFIEVDSNYYIIANLPPGTHQPHHEVQQSPVQWGPYWQHSRWTAKPVWSSDAPSELKSPVCTHTFGIHIKTLNTRIFPSSWAWYQLDKRPAQTCRETLEDTSSP